MQLGTTFIRDGKFVIRDVDGSEVTFSATDALDLQNELHKHRMQLLEIAHTPIEPMFNATQALREQEEGEHA
jgi:hypothetical protein